jgi:hypothetical protein
MPNGYPNIFQGRRHCAQALEETLSALAGRSGVTESEFQRIWMYNIAKSGLLTENGWYCPPPSGAAVLAGTIDDVSRVSFKSLRDEANFANDKEIVWQEGLLFVYCSNVFMPELMPSDFSITLYFGRDPKLLHYFKIASDAARRIAEASLHITSSRQLFSLAQQALQSVGLANTIHSITDVTPLDYGHSLNRIDPLKLGCAPWEGNRLQPKVYKYVSASRTFINDAVDWQLDQVDAYTVEPQIVSLEDPSLPKVTFHYLITQTSGRSVESSIENFFPSTELAMLR